MDNTLDTDTVIGRTKVESERFLTGRGDCHFAVALENEPRVYVGGALPGSAYSLDELSEGGEPDVWFVLRRTDENGDDVRVDYLVPAWERPV